MTERGMGRIFKPMHGNKNGKWKKSAILWIAYYHFIVEHYILKNDPLLSVRDFVKHAVNQ
jgi:hypothetical protein